CRGHQSRRDRMLEPRHAQDRSAFGSHGSTHDASQQRDRSLGDTLRERVLRLSVELGQGVIAERLSLLSTVVAGLQQLLSLFDKAPSRTTLGEADDII